MSEAVTSAIVESAESGNGGGGAETSASERDKECGNIIFMMMVNE